MTVTAIVGAFASRRSAVTSATSKRAGEGHVEPIPVRLRRRSQATSSRSSCSPGVFATREGDVAPTRLAQRGDRHGSPSGGGQRHLVEEVVGGENVRFARQLSGEAQSTGGAERYLDGGRGVEDRRCSHLAGRSGLSKALGCRTQEVDRLVAGHQLEPCDEWFTAILLREEADRRGVGRTHSRVCAHGGILGAAERLGSCSRLPASAQRPGTGAPASQAARGDGARGPGPACVFTCVLVGKA